MFSIHEVTAAVCYGSHSPMLTVFIQMCVFSTESCSFFPRIVLLIFFQVSKHLWIGTCQYYTGHFASLSKALWCGSEVFNGTVLKHSLFAHNDGSCLSLFGSYLLKCVLACSYECDFFHKLQCHYLCLHYCTDYCKKWQINVLINILGRPPGMHAHKTSTNVCSSGKYSWCVR